MIISNDPRSQLVHQLKAYFPFPKDNSQIDIVYNTVLENLEFCFSHISNKYYRYRDEVFFDTLHVGQWTAFLYQMARQLYLNCPEKNRELCNMIYFVSKAISSSDIFYEVNLPEIWFFDHPQGSVIGRAEFGNYFSFGQCCTVGNNKGFFPIIGEHVSMMSGSKILGNCTVGDFVIMSADTTVIDMDIPSCSIVYGSGRDIEIKPITKERYREITAPIFST